MRKQLISIRIVTGLISLLWIGNFSAWSQAADQGPPAQTQPSAGDGAGETVPVTPDEKIDGPSFQVDQFVLLYAREHPNHPSLDTLLDCQVDLGLTDQGYIEPRKGVPIVTVTIGAVDQLPHNVFFESAITTVCKSIVVALHEHGLIGIFVEPDTRDIDRTKRDRRLKGQRSLRLLIRTAFVAENRTIASGDRVPPEARINNKRHSRILRLSPLQQAASGQSGDLLHKDVLDEFLFRLSTLR